jgi:uncharacterized membrane protein
MKKNHKIYFIVASVLAIISWAVALYHWDKLPDVIPVHFGIGGQADGWAQTSFFGVFMLPVLESFMTIMFFYLYRNPQYTNFPSTMWLMVLDAKSRKNAFDLIRKMLVGTLIWVNLLFTYLVYSMNVVAMDSNLKLSPWLLLVFVVGMLAWISYWTIKVYDATKKAIKTTSKK